MKDNLREKDQWSVIDGSAGSIRVPTSQNSNAIVYMEKYAFQDAHQIVGTNEILNILIETCKKAIQEKELTEDDRASISAKIEWGQKLLKDMQKIQYLLGPVRIATSSTIRDAYTCIHLWPADCKIQCGDHGVVFGKTGSYTTAFFEAFPRKPNTFIRGEGKTISEAEKAAWEKYQIQAQCKNHEFERRGYKNGAGFCKHCGFFKSEAFEPLEKCYVCGTPTFYTADKLGNFYCEAHKNDIPEENIPDYMKDFPPEMLEEKNETQLQEPTPLEKINQIEEAVWYYAWKIG